MVKSLVDVVPGTELSISYIDLGSDSFWAQDYPGKDREKLEHLREGDAAEDHSSTEEVWRKKTAVAGNRRRQKLLRDYHFVCNCSRCTIEQSGAECVALDRLASVHPTQPLAVKQASNQYFANMHSHREIQSNRNQQ